MRMINLLFMFSTISFIVSAHEEPSKTLNEQNDKAKSRQRIVESGILKSFMWKYTVCEGKLADKGSKAIIQEYDKNGNMTAIEAYNNDSLSLRVEYSFDSNNNMLTDIDYSADRKILEKNSYNYDNGGRVISGNTYNEEEQLSAYFIINKANDKKSIIFLKYKDNDSLEYKIEYLYSSNYDQSDYTEANKYDPNNKLIMRVIKKYNASSRQTEKEIYGGDGSLSYSFYYEYDNGGNLTAIIKKKSDGTVEWKDLYSYDKSGNCMEIDSYDSNDDLSSVVKYTYEYNK